MSDFLAPVRHLKSLLGKAGLSSVKAFVRGISGATIVIAVIATAISAFGAWASIAEIDQIARARGQVIAKARTQIIQSSDNGVLQDLMVEEGQKVSRGELLALMDQERALAAYEDSRNKVAALEAALARLTAEVYGTEILFPENLEEWPSFRENQKALFDRRQQALNDSIAVLQKTADLVRAELHITEPLLDAGDVGEAEVLRLRRQLSEVVGEIVNRRNQYFQDAQAEMTKTEEELEAQKQLLRERTTILEHTEVRAPVDGIVKNIEVSTLGASVRPGEILMELLPTGSELIVEAKYPPADVSSLRVGLPASVKLDAYDSSIYGNLEGRVRYISPDALTEKDPRSGETVYYRVRVGLPATEDSDAGDGLIVVNPGMTAMVEVRTRKRTVLSYLTKPITKTLSGALIER